jgi:hypothetical protein
MHLGRSGILLLATLPLLILLGYALTLAVCGEEGCGNEGPTVTNFAECAAAGFPVMESHPRQCRGPDGKLHREDIEIIPDLTESEPVSLEGTIGHVSQNSRTITLRGEATEEVALLDDAQIHDQSGDRTTLRQLQVGMTVRVSGSRVRQGVILGSDIRVLEMTTP